MWLFAFVTPVLHHGVIITGLFLEIQTVPLLQSYSSAYFFPEKWRSNNDALTAVRKIHKGIKQVFFKKRVCQTPEKIAASIEVVYNATK